MSPPLCPFCRTPYSWPDDVKMIQFEIAGAQAHSSRARPATSQPRGLAAGPKWDGRDGGQDGVLTAEDIAIFRRALRDLENEVRNEEIPRAFRHEGSNDDNDGEDEGDGEGQHESEVSWEGDYGNEVEGIGHGEGVDDGGVAWEGDYEFAVEGEAEDESGIGIFGWESDGSW